MVLAITSVFSPSTDFTVMHLPIGFHHLPHHVMTQFASVHALLLFMQCTTAYGLFLYLLAATHLQWTVFICSAIKMCNFMCKFFFTAFETLCCAIFGKLEVQLHHILWLKCGIKHTTPARNIQKNVTGIYYGERYSLITVTWITLHSFRVLLQITLG